MADARRLIVVATLAVAATARAAGPCDEGRAQTGLTVASAGESALAVAAVEADSPAFAGGVRVGDAVVQVNGTVPRGCGEWARTLRDARRERKAVLLLVRRGEADVPLVVAAAAWDRAVATANAAVPSEPPSVRKIVATPPPAPLPPETSVSVDEVTRGIGALGGGDRPSARLDGYRADLLRLHREVETLAARGSAPSSVVDGLRTVLGYYDAAGVAWASEEARREHDRQPRHIPSRDSAPAPFFEDSDVAATIDEFPFLRETVVRDPQPGPIGVESAGLWRPLQARALLWDHGHEELVRLSGWLAGGPVADATR